MMWAKMGIISLFQDDITNTTWPFNLSEDQRI